MSHLCLLVAFPVFVLLERDPVSNLSIVLALAHMSHTSLPSVSLASRPEHDPQIPTGSQRAHARAGVVCGFKDEQRAR